MDIGASGFIDPASGLGGLVNLDGILNSNGSHAKAVGTLTGTKMKFTPKGTPAPKTVVVKHTVDVDLDKQSGTLTEGDISIGKAVVHLTGTFRTQGDIQVLNMKLDARDMPGDELEAMLPSLGVVLPSGSQLKGGTLSAELGIVGPLDKTGDHRAGAASQQQTGRVRPGIKTGGTVGFCRESRFQPGHFDPECEPQRACGTRGTKAENINLTVPAVGVITGAGTVSPAGALNFKMLADLKGGVAGGLTQVAALGSGKSGIPFAIEGTTSNPHFIPDMKGVAGGIPQAALGGVMGGKDALKGNPANAIGGLLGKKLK